MQWLTRLCCAIVGRGPLKSEFRITIVGTQQLNQLELAVKEIAVRVVCDFGSHKLSNVTQNEVRPDQISILYLSPFLVHTELAWVYKRYLARSESFGVMTNSRMSMAHEVRRALDFGSVPNPNRSACFARRSHWLLSMGEQRRRMSSVCCSHSSVLFSTAMSRRGELWHRTTNGRSSCGCVSIDCTITCTVHPVYETCVWCEQSLKNALLRRRPGPESWTWKSQNRCSTATRIRSLLAYTKAVRAVNLNRRCDSNFVTCIHARRDSVQEVSR